MLKTTTKTTTMVLLVLSFAVFFVVNADDYTDNFELGNNNTNYQFEGDDLSQAASYSDGAVFRETFEAGNNTNYHFNGNGVIQAYRSWVLGLGSWVLGSRVSGLGSWVLGFRLWSLVLVSVFGLWSLVSAFGLWSLVFCR
jgi:hypothetical protein